MINCGRCTVSQMLRFEARPYPLLCGYQIMHSMRCCSIVRLSRYITLRWMIEGPFCIRCWFVLLLHIVCVNWAYSQHPHGEDFAMDCRLCHHTESWTITPSYWQERSLAYLRALRKGEDTDSMFLHQVTGFDLTGQHREIDCRACHASLVFADERGKECIDCHRDVHQMTTVADCAACHDTRSWLIDDVTTLHERAGFALTGVHAVEDCAACHQSQTHLRFDPIGNECIACHRQDYLATTSPSHVELQYSTNCMDCHNIETPGWTIDGSNHFFFPLTGAHDIPDCTQCHQVPNFSDISSACMSCHDDERKDLDEINHLARNFPTDCALCHSIEHGWPTRKYRAHDGDYFPIFRGEHKGEWSSCHDCHIDRDDFKVFSCIDCHEHSDPDDLADEHDDVKNYRYESRACLECHPDPD